MAKMKAGNLTGIGNHNQRKTENHSNKDIDIERSHLNYDLVNRTENYKADIENYINENKSTSRAVRKDAVLINEWIITSDNNFFEDLSDERAKEFFVSAKEYFAENFGEENIRYATIHLDETTPHMHLGIVPFDKENKLSAKRVFDRKALQKIQDELPKYLKERDFDLTRGEKGSERKHLSVPEYKKAMQEKELIQKETEALKKDKNALEMKIEPLKRDVSSLENNKESLAEQINVLRDEIVVDVDYKKLKARYEMKDVEVDTGEVDFLKRKIYETKKERTGNVILPYENFNMLVKNKKKVIEYEKKVDRYMNTDLVKENKNIKEDYKNLENQYEDIYEHYSNEFDENLELREENKVLNATVEKLKDEITGLYINFRDFISERTPDLKTFKQTFESFTNKFKSEFSKSEFEKVDDLYKFQEKRRSQNRGMSR